VSCAIALAVLDVIEEDKLRENSVAVGKYLVDRLTDLQRKHHLIGDIRGRGLFVGVELVNDLMRRSPATAQAEHIIYRYVEINTEFRCQLQTVQKAIMPT
jgi:ethanolamine-phosphate phospho-lyase